MHFEPTGAQPARAGTIICRFVVIPSIARSHAIWAYWSLISQSRCHSLPSLIMLTSLHMQYTHTHAHTHTHTHTHTLTQTRTSASTHPFAPFQESRLARALPFLHLRVTREFDPSVLFVIFHFSSKDGTIFYTYFHEITLTLSICDLRLTCKCINSITVQMYAGSEQ